MTSFQEVSPQVPGGHFYSPLGTTFRQTTLMALSCTRFIASSLLLNIYRPNFIRFSRNPLQGLTQLWKKKVLLKKILIEV